jgi:hypothetical protein
MEQRIESEGISCEKIKTGVAPRDILKPNRDFHFYRIYPDRYRRLLTKCIQKLVQFIVQQELHPFKKPDR